MYHPSMANAVAEQEVRIAVEIVLSKMKVKGIAGINPFLSAIEPEVAHWSSVTRSLSSQLGGRLQELARDLACRRFGEDHVPPLVAGTGVTDTRGWEPDKRDTIVICRLDRAEVSRLATKLRIFAKGSEEQRIGTDPFKAEFALALHELAALPQEREPWKTFVDLYINDDGLGLCEMESGGMLDTSNAPSQTEKLIRAGLAYGKVDINLRWALAYDNSGEGKAVTQLRNFLAPEALLIGPDWWARLLPGGVSYERFLEIFGEEATKIDLVPPGLRSR